MESKKIGIKNRTYFYFDDIIGVRDRDSDMDSDFEVYYILLDKKLYKEKGKNILIYDI